MNKVCKQLHAMKKDEALGVDEYQQLISDISDKTDKKTISQIRKQEKVHLKQVKKMIKKRKC